MKKTRIADQEEDAIRIKRINVIVAIAVACLLLAGTVFGYFMVKDFLTQESETSSEETTTSSSFSEIILTDVTDGTLNTSATTTTLSSETTTTSDTTDTSSSETSETSATSETTGDEHPVSKNVYTTSKLNVRSGPDTTFPIKDSISKGKQITVVAETDNGWYKLDNGYYISKKFTTDKLEATPTATPTSKPKDSNSSSKSSITELKAGTVLKASEIDTKNLDQYFTSSKIKEGDAVYKRINGKSYKANSNIKLSDLRYLKMIHVNFNGEYQVGEMICNKSIASDLISIFKQLCKDKYQIQSMYLIDNYWTGKASSSDWASIEANNTSCFCYREASGSSKLSKHALGRAVDINPLQNPYVSFKNGKASCSHDGSKKYMTNRTSDMPHVITKSDKAYKLFKNAGFTWGGAWSNPKDYQNFQK